MSDKEIDKENRKQKTESAGDRKWADQSQRLQLTRRRWFVARRVVSF